MITQSMLLFFCGTPRTKINKDRGGLVSMSVVYDAGIVGEIDDGGDGYYIWTHKKFDIGHNDKQIVDVNLTSESKVKLVANIKISFSYEVS